MSGQGITAQPWPDESIRNPKQEEAPVPTSITAGAAQTASVAHGSAMLLKQSTSLRRISKHFPCDGTLIHAFEEQLQAGWRAFCDLVT